MAFDFGSIFIFQTIVTKSSQLTDDLNKLRMNNIEQYIEYFHLLYAKLTLFIVIAIDILPCPDRNK